MKVSPVSRGIHVWHGKYKQPSTAQVRPYRAVSQENAKHHLVGKTKDDECEKGETDN